MSTLSRLRSLDRTSKAEVYYAGPSARDKLRYKKSKSLELVVLYSSISKVIRYLTSYNNSTIKSIRRLKGAILVRENGVEILIRFPSIKRKKSKISNRISLLKLDSKRYYFTIDTIYVPIRSKNKSKIIDLHHGRRSIQNRKIETIENPKFIITKHPELIIEALTLNATLNYSLSAELYHNIKINTKLIDSLDKKIIRDGLISILLSKKPSRVFKLMFKLGVLQIILPELAACRNLRQNSAYHKYDVFEHCLLACDAISADLILRLAALFHDIGKAPTAKKTIVNGKTKITFYNHEIVSARLTFRILRRLKFPNALISKVADIVRSHMYNYNPSAWKDAAVDRLIERLHITEKDLADLNQHPVFQLRRADRIATGKGLHEVSGIQLNLERRIKDRFRKTLLMTRKDLEVDGHVLMKTFHLTEGPTIGHLLSYLFELVTKDPSLNTKEKLIEEASKYLSKALK